MSILLYKCFLSFIPLLSPQLLVTVPLLDNLLPLSGHGSLSITISAHVCISDPSLPAHSALSFQVTFPGQPHHSCGFGYVSCRAFCCPFTCLPSRCSPLHPYDPRCALLLTCLAFLLLVICPTLTTFFTFLRTCLLFYRISISTSTSTYSCFGLRSPFPSCPAPSVFSKNVG